jgi:hypothetical protein
LLKWQATGRGLGMMKEIARDTSGHNTFEVHEVVVSKVKAQPYQTEQLYRHL